MIGQPKQANSEVNRRAGTSAAVIGLAISVTAQGLLFHRQGDRAIAAEPAASEPATTAMAASYDVATLSSTEAASSSAEFSTIQHTVQEGQTLWKIARFYGVDAAAIAEASSISSTSVLYVGQVLTIPLDTRVARAIQPGEMAATPGYYGPIANAAEASQQLNEADASLKAEQDVAVDRMKQKRDDLQSSLLQLKTRKQESSVAILPQPVATPPESTLPLPERTSSSTTHRVAVGETLSKIARNYGVSLSELITLNRMADPNVVFVDQVLKIPQSQTQTELSSSEVPTLVASTNLPQSTLPLSAESNGSIASSQSVSEQPVSVSLLPSPTPASQPPSLPNPIVPVEKDNAATVAVAPFVRNQPGQAEETSRLRYHYVENLRQEIVKLREKYQGAPLAKQSTPTSTTKVAASSLGISSSTRMNPEFNPADYSEKIRSQVQRLRNQAQPSTVAPASAPMRPQAAQPQRVAAAPLGSQSYDPLVPSIGQMVSPDLPPLGPVENYLPRHPGKFNGYIWPAKGVLTSGYGWRWGRMHKGIDIAAPIGTPIVAAASGIVITSGWNSGGYGYLIEIQHADGSVTLYAHNNRLLVREGAYVEQGQQIAEMGSTGYSTGPHSHFEVHLPGQGAVNPIAYLSKSDA